MNGNGRIKVILVTEDVTDKAKARRYLKEERKAGNYKPVLVRRWGQVDGQTRRVYAVGRVPTTVEDQVFMHELEVQQQVDRYLRADPIVIEVKDSQLLELI